MQVPCAERKILLNTGKGGVMEELWREPQGGEVCVPSGSQQNAAM